MRLTLAVTLVLVLTLGCATTWTPEQGIPENIAGEWTYQFADGEHQGGTIIIPNDTASSAITLMTSDFWPGSTQYLGVLHGLARSGRYVCWADRTRQTFGFELTIYGGRLSATYFSNCRGLARRVEGASQRWVRDCKHTILTLHRAPEP